MPRVRLVHWNAREAASYFPILQDAGFQIDYQEKLEPGAFSHWKQSPPDAFVIDLSRLPSHGREVATALRGSKATRCIPIVFSDGDPVKVDAIRKLLPDATYTARSHLRSALKQALKRPSTSPIVPAQMMDRYAHRTAAQKLGIRESTSVALVDPPRDYRRILGELPQYVALVEEPGQSCPVTLCFARGSEPLELTLSRLRGLAAHSKLWILWPKKTSNKAGRVSEQLIRDSALPLGLVDYKVCSVNETWSAILFALKKTKA